MKKYDLIKSINSSVTLHNNDSNVILHEDILDILFKHKEEIYRKLIDLRGTFLIDHIAIKIIDPNNKILIFSITPSVEYNLIVQGLWKHDKSFSLNFQKNNSFYIWEEAYPEKYFDELKSIKELKHGFTFGFNLSKTIGSFNLTYSFATRSKNNKLLEYYQSHINELFALGDYGYKLIHNIYANYCNPQFNLPTGAQNRNYYEKPILKLIVNNK